MTGPVEPVDRGPVEPVAPASVDRGPVDRGPVAGGPEGTAADRREAPYDAVPPAADTGDDGARPYGDEVAPRTVDPRSSARTHGRRRRHPWRLAALAVIVAGLVILVGGYLWVQHEANPGGPQGAQVIVTVPAGSGENAAASLLASRGVITSAFAYRLWSQFNSLPGIRPGPYAFRANSSFAQAQAVLAAGPNVFPLDVPAGFTVSELATRVGQLPGHQSEAFDHAATDGSVRSPWQPAGVTSLEGLLAPGTYIVPPGETDQHLLQRMVDRFDAQAARIGLAAGAQALGRTPYQVITIASIVEKEGVIDKNLGPVARVVYNRLARNMPLQMDSTVLYALGRDGGTVTAADLRTVSPYNTYLNKGLPPTPTCFPSEASLQAALDPPAGSWLYFVVVAQDGTEAFSDTFAGQQANEAVAAQHGLG